jgi:hypothetical protein
MNYIKLQYEPGLGGAHSNEVKIPGLIAKEKDAFVTPQKNIGKNTKYNTTNYHDILQGFVKDKEQELNAKYNEITRTVEQIGQNVSGYVDPTIGTTTEPLIPSPQYLLDQNLNQWGSNQKYFNQKQAYGLPAPKYRKPPDDTNSLEDYIKMMEHLRKNPPKSEFEIIIDSLFNSVEKLDFLKSIGYEHILGDNVRSSSIEEGLEVTESVQQAFLREMCKKFKNMLLAKGTIKIKF